MKAGNSRKTYPWKWVSKIGWQRDGGDRGGELSMFLDCVPFSPGEAAHSLWNSSVVWTRWAELWVTPQVFWEGSMETKLFRNGSSTNQSWLNKRGGQRNYWGLRAANLPLSPLQAKALWLEGASTPPHSLFLPHEATPLTPSSSHMKPRPRTANFSNSTGQRDGRGMEAEGKRGRENALHFRGENRFVISAFCPQILETSTFVTKCTIYNKYKKN